MFYKLSMVCVITGIMILYMWSKKPFDEGVVHGRNVLITGASSGIGEQLAYKYAKMGANVFITARREHLLKQVVEKCKKLGPSGGKYSYYVADMADYKVQSKILIEKAVSFLGGLDTLVINHGMKPKQSVWYGTPEEFDWLELTLRVDALSYFHVASYALPYLKTSSKFGRMGIVSTVVGGKTDVSTIIPYSTAKFALDGFFSSLRTELHQARQNISVTLLLLGSVDTDHLKTLEEGAKRLQITPDDMIMRDLDKYKVQPNDTAYQIVMSTEMGHSELYYPFWHGATKFSYPASLTPVVRHLMGSKYTQLLEMTEQFYKKYEKKFHIKNPIL